MDLREIIEAAEKKLGSQQALAEYIHQRDPNIRAAKRHERPLPNYACVMIADLLDMDRITVIAASELATEKHPERREVWLPFVNRAAGVALAIAVTVASSVAHQPANASTGKAFQTATTARVCIMSTRLRARITRNFRDLLRYFADLWTATTDPTPQAT